MRITLANLKSSRIPATLNVGPNDSRFTAYVNEACERLFNTGENFWGITQQVVMCCYSGCLVFPRRVASIESVAVCNTPLQIRNQWFEYSGNGLGLANGDGCCNSNSNQLGINANALCGGGSMFDRGTTCTFSAIRGADPKRIKVYADVAESGTAKITLQGYDSNGQWIKTMVDTQWIDGEQVLISTTPQTSTKIFSNLVAVQKPQTNGSVRLYEYNTVTTTQRAIAVYEPSETNPVYRQYLIPGLEHGRCCDDSDDDGNTDESCQRVRVTAIARMEFVPVSLDADWVLPGCIPAIKDMVQSVRFMEMNQPQEALVFEAKAISQLRTQLRQYLGHGMTSPVKMLPANIAGGAVVNLM